MTDTGMLKMHLYPLLIGKLDAGVDILFRGGDPRTVVPFFLYCYLIADAGGKSFVDIGFGDLEYAQLTWKRN